MDIPKSMANNNIEINRIMKMKWNFCSYSCFVFEIIGYSNCLTFWPSFKGSMARMVGWGEREKKNEICLITFQENDLISKSKRNNNSPEIILKLKGSKLN